MTASTIEQAHQPEAVHPHGHHDHEEYIHIAPLWLLLAVWGGLMVLTFITVAATWIDLGSFNLWLAMIIATVKASLVALYFMHLRWDKPFNTFVLLFSLAFVALFIAGAMTDVKEYQPELIPGHAPLIEQ